MKIYMTHCSAQKDAALRGRAIKVSPDKLYTARQILRFMKKCLEKQVKWAIFSDKYGVWFPHVRHEWYEKNPDTVNESEFRKLLKDVNRQLRRYETVFFYYNPRRFHPFYRKLLRASEVYDKVRFFSHLKEIKG